MRYQVRLLEDSGTRKAGDEYCCDGPEGERLVAEGIAEIIGAKVRVAEERKDDTGYSTNSRTRKSRRSKAASKD